MRECLKPQDSKQEECLTYKINNSLFGTRTETQGGEGAWKWKWKWFSHVWLFVTPLWPHGLHSPWNSPGQNTEVWSYSLLQGIFPNQGSNPGLLHCRWILYQLSHQGNPRILQWVAYPFSSGSSRPRNRIGASCIADRFFTNWAMREAI